MIKLTDEGHFVAHFIILHEELIAIEYMLRQVPSDSIVESNGAPVENGRYDSGLKVSANTGLRSG